MEILRSICSFKPAAYMAYAMADLVEATRPESCLTQFETLSNSGCGQVAVYTICAEHVLGTVNVSTVRLWLVRRKLGFFGDFRSLMRIWWKFKRFVGVG